MKPKFVALTRMLCAVAVAVATVPVSARAQVAQTRSSSEIADSLFTAMNAAAALAVLRVHLEKAPDDFDALWRETRAAVVLSILTEDREEKLRLLHIGVDAGERLLALRPDDAVALSWAASAKGRLAMEVHNPLTSTRLAKDVWILTGNVLARQPDNAMANGIRGKFIQEVRRLSWGERVFARLILGGDIAGAVSWGDSERYLARAVAGDPNMVVYHLDLGDTYRLQHKDAQALEAYRRGLSLPSRYPVDDYYKRRIREGVRALAPHPDGAV